MTDLIERVAKAICEACNGVSPFQWSLRDEASKNRFRAQAYAAIAAMREPTGGMFTAGQKAVASMDPKAVRTVDWEQVYRAMIDAALNTGGRDGDEQG